MIHRSIILIISLIVFNTGNTCMAQNCEFDEYHIVPMILDSQYFLEKCKVDMEPVVFKDAVSLVNIYWDTRTSNIERYALLSESYKQRLSKYHQIKSESQYSIPLAEYERVWFGYKITEIVIVEENLIQVSVQQKWSQEGYKGILTYIMGLKKEKKPGRYRTFIFKK